MSRMFLITSLIWSGLIAGTFFCCFFYWIRGHLLPSVEANSLFDGCDFRKFSLYGVFFFFCMVLCLSKVNVSPWDSVILQLKSGDLRLTHPEICVSEIQAFHLWSIRHALLWYCDCGKHLAVRKQQWWPLRRDGAAPCQIIGPSWLCNSPPASQSSAWQQIWRFLRENTFRKG